MNTSTVLEKANSMAETEGLQPEQQENDAKTEAKRTYSSSEHQLPDINHNFDYQLKIIDACVVTTDYGKREAMGAQVQSNLSTTSNSVRTTISFLGTIGILDGDTGRFRPTEGTVDFHYSRRAGKEEEARLALARIINGTWFAESARQLVAVKGTATEEDIVNKLARDCRVDPAKRNRSLKSLLDYLKYARILLQKEDEKLVLGQNNAVAGQVAGDGKNQPVMIDKTDMHAPPLAASQNSAAQNIGHNLSDSGKITINLNFNVLGDTTEEQVRKIIRAVKEEMATNNK